MKTNSRFIIKSIVLLLLGLIISFLLDSYTQEIIIYKKLVVSGLIFNLLIIFTSIIISKTLYKKQKINSYLNIILTTVFIVTISELIFQIIRQFTMESDSFWTRIITICRATLSIGIFGAIVSFLTLFQIKTKKTGYLILLIIGILVSFNFIIKAMA